MWQITLKVQSLHRAWGLSHLALSHPLALQFSAQGLRLFAPKTSQHFGGHACRFSSVALHRLLIVLCSVSPPLHGSSACPEQFTCTFSCQISLIWFRLPAYVKTAIWRLGRAGAPTASQEPGHLGAEYYWDHSTTGIHCYCRWDPVGWIGFLGKSATVSTTQAVPEHIQASGN